MKVYSLKQGYFCPCFWVAAKTVKVRVILQKNKAIVNDEAGKMLYSIKKKTFSSKYVLFDTNDYNLYTLESNTMDQKPSFKVFLRDQVYVVCDCTSLFLNPTIEVKGNEIDLKLTGKNHKTFKILHNKDEIGEINVIKDMAGSLQYDIEIENKFFDDYIVLFGIMLDITFGKYNK